MKELAIDMVSTLAITMVLEQGTPASANLNGSNSNSNSNSNSDSRNITSTSTSTGDSSSYVDVGADPRG